MKNFKLSKKRVIFSLLFAVLFNFTIYIRMFYILSVYQIQLISVFISLICFIPSIKYKNKYLYKYIKKQKK